MTMWVVQVESSLCVCISEWRGDGDLLGKWLRCQAASGQMNEQVAAHLGRGWVWDAEKLVCRGPLLHRGV